MSSHSASPPASPRRSSSSPSEETMQIFIKDVSGNTTELNIPPSTSLATIKSLTTLHSPESKPSASSRLIHAGNPLTDPSSTLASLSIPPGATLHLAAPPNKTSMSSSTTTKKAKCAFKDCKQKPQPIVGECGFCSLKYCGKHRLLESHECVGLNDCKDEARERNKDRLEGERTMAVRGV